MERCDVITRAYPRPVRTNDELIADGMFELFMSLTLAPRCALFRRGPDGQLALSLSRGVDQLALDLARGAWTAKGEPAAGAPWYGQSQERSYLMLPCTDADATAGVLYAEVNLETRRVPAAHLAAFAGIFGLALRAQAGFGPAPETVAPPPPVERRTAAERANLALLLERHEWNVSRVARALGVTRMTVYNRMRRLKLPRQRVRKSPPRRAR